MSISPQPKSNEPSRPASPAADALESLSLDEEAISPEEAIKMKANHRKSSSWKGLKNQLSRAEMKIKSTFTEPFTKERKGSVIFYGSAAEGTLLSPVELSPDSVESGASSPDQDEKIEKISDLIKNIEELGSECDNVAPKASKRVEFLEEPCKKTNVLTIEGAGISRPTELSFGDAPVAPPRMKKDGSKRLERLLSVPNLKLNRQDQNRLLNLRKTSNVVDQKSNKNKGNFIRRFSKYQFQSFTHTTECFFSFLFASFFYYLTSTENSIC